MCWERNAGAKRSSPPHLQELHADGVGTYPLRSQRPPNATIQAPVRGEPGRRGVTGVEGGREKTAFTPTRTGNVRTCTGQRFTPGGRTRAKAHTSKCIFGKRGPALGMAPEWLKPKSRAHRGGRSSPWRPPTCPNPRAVRPRSQRGVLRACTVRTETNSIWFPLSPHVSGAKVPYKNLQNTVSGKYS